MSGSASIGLEQAILGHTLGFSTLPATTNAYVALCALAPPPTEVTGGAEASGGGYSRVAATFALVDAPANLAANVASVEWPIATASWGTMGYFELWDSASGGNRLYWGQLLDPVAGTPITVAVVAGDIVRFSAGALAVQAATGTGGTTSAGAYLPLIGGTLSGPLTLAADPMLPLVAATKQYVDAHVAPGAPFVPVTNPITNAPGMASFPSIDQYQSPDSYALTGSMTVRGQPYGYYDTGTLLSLVSTTLPLSSSRAGVAGGFENGVSAIAGYGSLDLVTLYTSVVPSPPPLVLHSVTYDATHVYPATPLTPTQMSALRKNMWVITNSINTSVIATPSVPNGLTPETHYASYVTGWASDGSSITVCGWTVPGSHIAAAGQVPSNTLDPGAANATAYFGAPTNVFGGNFVLQHNPTAVPDSRTRTLQGIEFDFQNYGTTNHALAVAGISMDYNPINGAACTADSYGIKLSGFPTGIIVNYSTVGLNIDPNTVTTAIISGALNVFDIGSPAPWAGAPTTNLTWESQNYIDTNLMRLQCWVSRDEAGGGWPTASMHLGLRVDGTPETLTGGVLMGQIVWSGGGITLENGAGAQPIQVDPNGYVHLAGLANAANDAAAATAGVPVSGVYRNGSVLMVRVA